MDTDDTGRVGAETSETDIPIDTDRLVDEAHAYDKHISAVRKQIRKTVDDYDADTVDRLVRDRKRALAKAPDRASLESACRERASRLSNMFMMVMTREEFGIDEVLMFAGMCVGGMMSGGFGSSAKHQLRQLDRAETCERWCAYMDSRVADGLGFLPLPGAMHLNDFYCTSARGALINLMHGKTSDLMPMDVDTYANYCCAIQIDAYQAYTEALASGDKAAQYTVCRAFAAREQAYADAFFGDTGLDRSERELTREVKDADGQTHREPTRLGKYVAERMEALGMPGVDTDTILETCQRMRDLCVASDFDIDLNHEPEPVVHEVENEASEAASGDYGLGS